MKDPRISSRIIAVNYNGEDLLKRFLPSWIRSARASRFPCAVSVLDNGSSDGSVSYVKERFPEATVIVSKENKVLCSYNGVVREMDEDVVILINNDVETEENFVDPLLEVFLEKPNVFFVSTYGDCSIARNRWGVIGADITYRGVGAHREKVGYAFSAGIAAFDRKKFIELRGYDELYLPAIYDDIDLCYRGWKRGWVGYYQPASRKFHIGSASMSRRYTPAELQKIAFRNGILFMAKNISDPLLLANFIFFLKLRLVGAAFLGKWAIVQGFIEALQRLPRALRSRSESVRKVPYGDRELLRRINEGREPRE